AALRRHPRPRFAAARGAALLTSIAAFRGRRNSRVRVLPIFPRIPPAQLHPEVAPHVSHLQHAPLRTRVSCPHSLHGSPSYPLSRARRIFSASLVGTSSAAPVA